MRKLIVLVSLVVINHNLFGQSDTTKTEGEIISGEVVIEKDNKIVLPQADKIFIRSQSKDFGSQPVKVSFLDVEPIFEWPEYKTDVPFRQLDEPYPSEEYQNYLKLGFGNYTSPLIEAGIFKKFNSLDTKGRFFYESFKSGPVNGENSGNARGEIDLSADYRSESLLISPSIQYKNLQYNFFGNANRTVSGFSSEDVDEVSLNDFDFKIKFAGGKEDFHYSVTPRITSVSQNLKTGESINKESIIGANGSFDFKIDEKFTTGIEIDANSASYDGGIQIDRSLVNVHPWVSHVKDKLSIKAGFMISSGKVGESSKTSFYPKALVNYDFTSKWSFYGFVSGGQQWNELGQLLNENEFLDDSLAIVNSENTIQIGGGIKGSPIKNLLLNVSLDYRSINGLPFYVASASDSSRHILAYDNESVGIVTLRSELSYMPTATSTYGIQLNIFGYSLESLDRPWHQPSYVFKAYTSHNVQEKLILSAYVSSMGGIRGPANVDFGYVRLSAFTDVGLSAKYLVTTRASAFITVNNLLNDEYERYLGYPTRGITFKIGGQYRF